MFDTRLAGNLSVSLASLARRGEAFPRCLSADAERVPDVCPADAGGSRLDNEDLHLSLQPHHVPTRRTDYVRLPAHLTSLPDGCRQ